MSLEEKRKRIVDDMSYLPDRFERFTYIVDYAKDRETIPEELRTDTFRVEGCQSQLWLVPGFKEGICSFSADSDSAIVKGIATIICDYYSDETPETILSGDVKFLEEVGVDQHLSSNRRNGLGKVDERIKRFAESCLESGAEK
ncbi:SufE family protein [Puniceicoccales bacterium CK1056]|uniref:SufE family protein n=1 Tax=Oceanipulchritudo coccoides TaxID=2706888 RepID=A0A6B2LYY4_9BACT|nr:SufE family protein [Oceanipulchritudo coccoides]NDV61838.1 SufE family protein [Oceanipulchritudo coccoides]